jgi:ATP-dependent DNA helicase RecQ
VQQEILQQFIRGELNLLYVAPERLGSGQFLSAASRAPLSLLAVDEAHCISEWGMDFRPDYRKLNRLLDRLLYVPVLALTASATPRIQKDIAEQIGRGEIEIYNKLCARSNIHHEVWARKNSYEKITKLLSTMEEGVCLIYCNSRDKTESIAEKLKAEGESAGFYHAGMEPYQRELVQKSFESGKIRVLCCTSAFGMGVDRPDVRMVLHLGMPKSLEAYYQQSGRAGRDGAAARSILFYSYADVYRYRFSIAQERSLHRRQILRAWLQSMLGYCQTVVCRVQYLDQYFGRVDTESCGVCDFCQSNKISLDGTEISRKILSCILRTGQRFDRLHIVDVLKGKLTDDVVEHSHDGLSVFGIELSLSSGKINTVIESLLQADLLRRSSTLHEQLLLTEKGADFLRKKKQWQVMVSEKAL